MTALMLKHVDLTSVQIF